MSQPNTNIWDNIDLSKDIKSVSDVTWSEEPYVYSYNSNIHEYYEIMEFFDKNDITESKIYVLGTGLLSKNLCDQFYRRIQSFNILYTPHNKKLYMQLNHVPYIFWHTFETSKQLIEQLPHLIKIYNPTEYQIDYDHKVTAIIATRKMFKITDLEDRLFKSNYTEVFFWGSKWKDFPFLRSEVKNYGHLLQLTSQHSYHQINKEYYSMSFRTLYSKSIMEIIDANDEYFLVEVRYNPTKLEDINIECINKKLERYYPLDLPMDVIIALQTYVFCPEDIISSNMDKDDCISNDKDI